MLSSGRPSKGPWLGSSHWGADASQATADDVPNIAEVHVRSWQAAYRGILADDLLDRLSVTEREGSWRALLSNTEHHWLKLVAENGMADSLAFAP